MKDKIMLPTILLGVAIVTSNSFAGPEPQARLYRDGQFVRLVTPREFVEELRKSWDEYDATGSSSFLCSEPASSPETPCVEQETEMDFYDKLHDRDQQ